MSLHLPRLYLAVALTAATLVLFGLAERYDVLVPQLLNNGDFGAARVAGAREVTGNSCN